MITITLWPNVHPKLLVFFSIFLTKFNFKWVCFTNWKDTLLKVQISSRKSSVIKEIVFLFLTGVFELLMCFFPKRMFAPVNVDPLTTFSYTIVSFTPIQCCRIFLTIVTMCLNSAPLRKNTVSAFQILFKLLSFTFEDSWRK